MQTSEKEMKIRLAELQNLIRETRQRLPAHSTKPPIMMELLAYEDEYEALLTDLNQISDK